MKKISNRLPLAALAIASLGLAACGGKKPLPEAPPATNAVETPAPAPTPTPTPGPDYTTPAIAPGSKADFINQAGTDTVLFAYDSYSLDDGAREVLKKQAAWLAQYGAVRLTVEGHADERGTREYNIALGDRRATTVANYLIAQGVAANRINVISYGKEKPAVEGADEDSWARNRRAVTAVAAQ